MRIRPLKAVFVAAALGVMTLLTSGTASAVESAPPARGTEAQLSGAAPGTVDRFVAGPVRDGAASSQAEPPAFECLWGWETGVGGFYPEAWLSYAATFECGEDFGMGPDMAGVIQGSLHAAPGGLRLHTGPQENFLFCCEVELPPASSGGEITLTGPGSFYLVSDSIVDLLPPLKPGDPIWVWWYLPDGCVGVGTPRAVCLIESTTFDIT